MADIKGSFREISIAELERELAEELAVDLVDQIDTFLDSAVPRTIIDEPPPARAADELGLARHHVRIMRIGGDDAGEEA